MFIDEQICWYLLFINAYITVIDYNFDTYL